MLLAGAGHLFVLASAWYVIFAAELFAVMGLYLVTTWRQRRHDFWPMALILGAAALLMLLELGVQSGLLALPHVPVLQLALPLLFIGIGSRLLLMFARALQVAEATRSGAGGRGCARSRAEIERNFAQMAELRVEQVTEQERKRIAADLHDDLGAKLLTIVHTSESERISTLAREALEEMRLSVRGLTGKPMRLADALGRLARRDRLAARPGRTSRPTGATRPRTTNTCCRRAPSCRPRASCARRSATSSSTAARPHCKVRCAISERQFGLTVQDNGHGIPHGRSTAGSTAATACRA